MTKPAAGSQKRQGPLARKSASDPGTGEMAFAGAGFVTVFIDQAGIIDVDRVANAFRMTKGQLAETVGLAAATVSKAERRTAPRTQSRMLEMLEIVSRIRE
jgi:DNA-binding XRE family transcriptional regulator